jgi:hypothetical protein
MNRTTIATAALLLASSLIQAGPSAAAPTGDQDDQMLSCPMHAQHMHEQSGTSAHLDAVNARGDEAMGFSHARTTHHFRLYPDGGAIDVSANGASDLDSRDRIRVHLRSIAAAFSEGRFDTPMAVHDRIPPGVPAMERLKADISYTYEETELGARVRITTNNPEALGAVHEFLRFQIEDHQTGDPTDVTAGR